MFTFIIVDLDTLYFYLLDLCVNCWNFKEFRYYNGEMAEWFKAHAWRACIEETLSWVRIPLSPPQ